MPETPPNDDQFADLFSRLPAPASRAGDVGGSSPESPPPADAAPLSRRAARAAAGTATPAPSAEPRTPQTLDALFAADADEDERIRDAKHSRDRRKSRIAGWVVFAVILAILGGVAAGGLYVWNTYEDKIRAFMGWEEPKDYAEGEATGDVSVTIVSGDTGATISQTLFEAGVTKTENAFYDYLIDSGENPTFQPGVYALRLKMTSAAALEALMDPASRQENSVLVTEGMTAAQAIVAISAGTGIAEEQLTAAAADYTQFGVPADAPSIEGFLFPATYTFDDGVTAEAALQRMVDETFSRLDALGVAAGDRLRVLTLAGLVQKESGPSAEDMRKIARVFLNRIDEGMPLQSDATVAYGAGSSGTVWTTQEQRDDPDNLYNTYYYKGLPPGPISNPGEAAIEAAIAPAEGSWLYFVAVDLRTGETVFSDTYAEHLAAVDQLDQWCRQEENASYCE